MRQCQYTSARWEEIVTQIFFFSISQQMTVFKASTEDWGNGI